MPTLARRAAPLASHKSAWNKAADSSRSASPLAKRLLQNSDNLRLPPQQRCCDIGCSPVVCFLSAGRSVCRGGVEDAGRAGAPRPYITSPLCNSLVNDVGQNPAGEKPPGPTWVAMGTRNDQASRQRMTLTATDPRPRSSPLSPPGATSL